MVLMQDTENTWAILGRHRHMMQVYLGDCHLQCAENLDKLS